MTHYISNDVLLLEQMELLLDKDVKLKLSEESILNVQKSEAFVKKRFGKTIDEQHALLKSYACGIGRPIPDTVVKLMLFLKIQSLCYGFSGVRLEIVNRLIDFFNHDVLPVVYSEDTPDDRISLAHLSLPLIGEGEVRISGKIFSACELTDMFGWKPLSVEKKEAEALLGGTQLTTAYGAYNLIRSMKLCQLSDFISIISAQIFGTDMLFFSEQVQIVRPHKGQIQTAEQLRYFLKNNSRKDSSFSSSQVPEAFSAIPQVHGAVKDTVSYVRKIIKTEINSTTDNLLIFPESEQILSGGNSHTLPLSLGLDFLSMALTNLGNISERRLFYLISSLLNKNSNDFIDLSVFQRITESILAENKRLSVPVSIESPIFTEKNTDIKGMGGSAAIKCSKVIKNIEQILAIELLTSTLISLNKNIEFTSERLDEYIKFLELDRAHSQDIPIKKSIEKTISFFAENKII